MPKFVTEREVPRAGNRTDAQLPEIPQKSVDVLKGLGPEIQWLHSYVTGDKVRAARCIFARSRWVSARPIVSLPPYYLLVRLHSIHWEVMIILVPIALYVLLDLAAFIAVHRHAPSRINQHEG